MSLLTRDPLLLAHMATQVRPGQVIHRLRLRAQRMALHRSVLARQLLLAGPPAASAVGWPSIFEPIDAHLWKGGTGLTSLQDGRIDLLGVTRRLAGAAGGRKSQPDWSSADWTQADAAMLWRFHLHYWDWAWALTGDLHGGQARTMFADMWQSWHAATDPGHGDAWLPYPAALRAWSWCGLYHGLVAGGPIENAFLASLAVHAGFLRRHLELDLGGNHLIKDLKAVAGLAIFFEDERMLRRALDLLNKQLAIQVLPDGGHFERAPAYHCQVLADLIDLVNLIQSASRTPPPALAMAIPRMRQWLSIVLSPQDDVPLLNDGYPVAPCLLRVLEPGTAPADPLRILPETGLVRAIAGDWHLLADVGPPCPDDLPGHAHADTFTCLVHVSGVPLLVDTATSTYQAGPTRSYERSTAAHNTAEVDGSDSTQVWGAFRAARRARVTSLAAHSDRTSLVIEAAHDGFRRLPGRPFHRRRWSLNETGLQIEDLITGTGTHTVTLRWHLTAGAELRLDSGVAMVQVGPEEFLVAMTGQPRVTVATESAPLATGFGRTRMAPVLIGQVHAPLPIRITTSWRRSGRTGTPTLQVTALTAGGV